MSRDRESALLPTGETKAREVRRLSVPQAKMTGS